MHRQHCKLRELPDKKRLAAAAKPTVKRFRNNPGILLVDDDHLVRIMVRLGLERNGFDVWLAANGREAIDLYQAHREDIAVVLLDVSTPGRDGPQALDALRQLDPQVVACFMSGDTGKCKPEELPEESQGWLRKLLHILSARLIGPSRMRRQA